MEHRTKTTEDFETLWKKLQGPLWRKAFTLTGNRDDADDLLSTTMTEMLQSFASFDPSKAKLEHWGATIMRNRNTDRLRKIYVKQPGCPDKAVELKSFEDVQDNQLAKCSEDYEQALTRMVILELLRRLSPDLRVVVILHYVEGLGTNEVARLLNIPPGTVSSRLHNALKRMKDLH